LTGERGTATKLAELDTIEARLDPEGRRRGRLTADLLTIAVLAPISIALDWHATRPMLMLTLMVVGVGLNHTIPLLTERSLRKKRAQLLAAMGDGEGGAR